ncbi:MAG: hypothetical protein EBY17_31300 [Acidobacteriia bacterium]|nr:hypothetical protein [Terriglobia bacterium]
MRYWGYLALKLGAAGALLYGAGRVLFGLLPPPPPVRHIDLDPFGTDLRFTVLVMIYTILSAGVLWAILLDHRYRCRTCLCRLRMPLLTGSWTHVLIGRPRTEYICPYGHGTLKVEELQSTGLTEPDWQPHEDMWKELAKK